MRSQARIVARAADVTVDVDDLSLLPSSCEALRRDRDVEESALHLEGITGEGLAGFGGWTVDGYTRGIEDTVVAGTEEAVVLPLPTYLGHPRWGQVLERATKSSASPFRCCRAMLMVSPEGPR